MHSKKPHRMDQINELIKERFGEVIMTALELPEGALVSVTQVKTSRDLRHAQIGLSIYPDDQGSRIFAAICRNLKKLKFALHNSITLKFSPDIKVYLDTTAYNAAQMDALLDTLKEKRKNQEHKKK